MARPEVPDMLVHCRNRLGEVFTYNASQIGLVTVLDRDKFKVTFLDGESAVYYSVEVGEGVRYG